MLRTPLPRFRGPDKANPTVTKSHLPLFHPLEYKFQNPTQQQRAGMRQNSWPVHQENAPFSNDGDPPTPGIRGHTWGPWTCHLSFCLPVLTSCVLSHLSMVDFLFSSWPSAGRFLEPQRQVDFLARCPSMRLLHGWPSSVSISSGDSTVQPPPAGHPPVSRRSEPEPGQK